MKNNSKEIAGGLKIGLEIGIAQINAQADFKMSSSHNDTLKNIEIKIHGSLKKPIIALNFFDLLADLKKLKDSPEDYLTPTPLYFSCIPMSAFLKHGTNNFVDHLRKEQLLEIHSLKKDFQTQLETINSLVEFAKDVSGKNKVQSADLRSVIDHLELIKNAFQIEFKVMQDDWIKILGRNVIHFDLPNY